MTWNATFDVVFLPTYIQGHELNHFLYFVKSLYWVIFHRSFYFLSNNVWCFKRIRCWNRLHTLYCHTASLAWSKTSTAERIYTYWCTFRSRLLLILLWKYKVGCVFLMVVVSLLHHVEFGPNDHREYAPHFRRHQIRFNFCIPIRRIWIFNVMAMDGKCVHLEWRSTYINWNSCKYIYHLANFRGKGDIFHKLALSGAKLWAWK